MTYSNNFEIQQHGNKIKVEDDKEQVSIVCSHDFWNEAPEDLLIEIFIRLPDCRSAARAIPVSRRWRSSIRRNPRFIDRFNSHHRRHPPESLPWAVMFRPNWCSEDDARHVYSDDWSFIHGQLPANCFDFLPSARMHIRASSNNLFLVSPIPHPSDDDDHYICNPFSKRFVRLPRVPPLPDTVSVANQRCGLIAYAIVRTSDNRRFKVVQALIFFHQLDRPIPVAIFCSESRKWKTKIFPCSGIGSGWFGGYHSTDNYIVTVEGVLYWIGWRDDREILVYLDLEKDKCGTIDIPGPADENYEHRIGAISHELRLLQVELNPRRIVYLTVWRLNNSEWVLVHDKRALARPDNSSNSFVGAFVHPTNGDLVWCVWGENVFEYNLVDSTCKKIVELSRSGRWSAEKQFLMVGAPDSASAGLDL